MRATSDSYEWSMSQYRSAVDESRDTSEDARDAWDELEKSIVASIADEVSVRIVGPSVEIVITKTFPA